MKHSNKSLLVLNPGGEQIMRAVSFRDKTVFLVDKPRPEVAADQVLLQPLMAGVCNTDVELFMGYYQFEGTPGHEFVSLVEKAPGDPQLVGKRVVCEINCGCGQCSWCKTGNQHHCPTRKVIGIKDWDGAFAEYVKAPLANVHLVDEAISDEAAVFVEPLAAALQISQQIHINSASRIAILGDGKLGLLIALALRHYNPGILLVGKHRQKLNLAVEQGVSTFHIESPDLLPDLGKILGSFDIVIEATGKEDGIDHGLNLVKPRGAIVLKTTSHSPSVIQLSRVVVGEISVVGSRCGDFGLALAFLQNKWVNVLPLIEAVYELDDFRKAFDHARQPGAKKILVRF